MKMKPCQWARWLLRHEFVAWDTETTGLEDDSAIVSMGIVDQSGNVLLDTLINPCVPIPGDATAIHGVTDEMVANAPTFAQVYPQIRAALMGKRWVIYNSGYDVPRLDYECWRWGLLFPAPMAEWKAHTWQPRWCIEDEVHCAMLQYADYYGDWSEYHGNNKWQKLSNAAQQMGIKVKSAHHALADAMTALELIKQMALREDKE